MKEKPNGSGFIARGGLWVLAQIVLLGAILVAPHLGAQRFLWAGSGSMAIGATLILLGCILAISGFIALGSSLTPMPHPRDDSELRTNGVYRLVRHPIYGGLVLGAAGYATLFPSSMEIALVLCAVLFFDRKATREERWLQNRYPAYMEYSRSTRKLFPWLY